MVTLRTSRQREGIGRMYSSIRWGSNHTGLCRGLTDIPRVMIHDTYQEQSFWISSLEYVRSRQTTAALYIHLLTGFVIFYVGNTRHTKWTIQKYLQPRKLFCRIARQWCSKQLGSWVCCWRQSTRGGLRYDRSRSRRKRLLRGRVQGRLSHSRKIDRSD